MKQWINNLLDKIGEKWACVLFWVLIVVGLFIVSTIHYFLFTKPVEDRVNAEWQEKYDEMVNQYEDQIWDIKKEWEEWYDKGYKEGYNEGYNEGINYGE